MVYWNVMVRSVKFGYGKLTAVPSSLFYVVELVSGEISRVGVKSSLLRMC